MAFLDVVIFLCLVFIPFSVPVYCLVTFVFGFLDALNDKITPQDCRKRYQVYSCYSLGVRLYHWLQERVR